MIQTQQNSRFSLTMAPAALPGQCRVCGSSQKLPLLDVGHSEEFHGAVYYCMECFGEMARVAGFIRVDSIPNLENELSVIFKNFVGFGGSHSDPSVAIDAELVSVSAGTEAVESGASQPTIGITESTNVEDVGSVRTSPASNKSAAKPKLVI